MSGRTQHSWQTTEEAVYQLYLKELGEGPMQTPQFEENLDVLVRSLALGAHSADSLIYLKALCYSAAELQGLVAVGLLRRLAVAAEEVPGELMLRKGLALLPVEQAVLEMALAGLVWLFDVFLEEVFDLQPQVASAVVIAAVVAAAIGRESEQVQADFDEFVVAEPVIATVKVNFLVVCLGPVPFQYLLGLPQAPFGTADSQRSSLRHQSRLHTGQHAWPDRRCQFSCPFNTRAQLRRLPRPQDCSSA